MTLPAPPRRGSAETHKPTDAQDQEARDQFNLRIKRRHQRILRMRAVAMDLKPNEMLERMIEFYDEHAGEL